MRHFQLKITLALIAATLVPIISHADDNAAKANEAFKARCLEVWVEKGDDVSDKTAYKTFGEKFCACAVDKPLENDAAINRTAQLCMSQTLLNDTMDNLQAQKGKANITADTFQNACVAKWSAIYPKMGDQAKTSTTSFCQCSAPKVGDLVKKQGLTDNDLSNQLNSIADNCADQVKMNSQDNNNKS